MLFLIALIVAFTFALFCGKALKKYPYVFYLAAVLLTVVTTILPSADTHNLPLFVNTYMIGSFTRGALATALWCVVMITGALPNGSALIKKLMPIRGELSIFTAILTLGHNIGYGKTYFVLLFTNRERMSENQIYASICTMIMLAVMIPLTVMSFPKIRKKMDARRWKKLQRFAYLFYALIYIHVMLLMIPLAKSGRDGYIFNVFVYSLVFFGYAFFRIRKFALKKENIYKKLVVNSAFVIAILMIIFVPLAARSVKENKEENCSENIKTFSISSAVSTETNETVTTFHTTTTTTATASTTASTSADTEETTGSTKETITTTETVTETVIEESAEEVNEEQVNDEPQQEEPPAVYGPEIPPEPQYIYNNGDFSASAFGYDGEVYVTVTIENDVIINISGYSNESDNWYFDSASGQIIPAILNSQDPDVDAYSGATYSSNAIIQAVKKALDSAKK